MSANRRLNKLETAVAALPPDGAALIHEVTSLPEFQRGAWLDARTDAELEAIVRADGGELANLDGFTDAELQRIVDGDLSPLKQQHRAGGGLCRFPNEPLKVCQTPAGKRELGKLRRRKIKAIRRRFGV
ncbi:MAG: hypothetical protein ACRD9Y_18175 [Blastocatellia bacterium]